MANLSVIIKKTLERNPHLGEDLLKFFNLENISEDVKNELLEAYYANVGARFFDDLWKNYLTDEQKAVLDEVLSEEPIERADFYNFLNDFVPNWLEILQYNMLMAKQEMFEALKFITEKARQITED